MYRIVEEAGERRLGKSPSRLDHVGGRGDRHKVIDEEKELGRVRAGGTGCVEGAAVGRPVRHCPAPSSMTWLALLSGISPLASCLFLLVSVCRKFDSIESKTRYTFHTCQSKQSK